MPVLFKKQEGSTPLTVVWKISETEEELIKILPPLKDEEKIFLSRLSFPARRLEWLASRILIHLVTGHYPAARYKDNGQPFLVDCNDKISISHTKGYAAISVSKDKIPGVDIEYPSSRIEKVMNRFLHPEEKAFLSNNSVLKERQLGLIWCLKEAVFKQCGIPGLIFKEQIISQPFTPEDDSGIFLARVAHRAQPPEVLNLQYFIHQDFYLAWTL
ncbi:4'-phosphopantetheinyl transferase superfamily protein [Marinilabilia salmonicolor]|jgi:phosphopantetheinyl transferase|uniref:Phosphopantetheinyl transferase n=1 Tax=Marinilabilia salmonicolor TaxID=989 RepID=A0A2T0XTA9_9BACT|nr:4'-phosphopantetheinyl transferase superfamily protein [Marinilabilia salmonicolor]PRZ02185.1 phosphopantetheinyl transferase [Marinilabilia salmonicolor]RCW36140.1 phosphopantetheinyl transferase [Marinilabilia salmonicolor]